MLFNSYPFLFQFLPVALAAYALLRRLPDPRPLLVALLGLSLVFYAAWDWRFVPLLVGSICVNGWVAGRIADAPTDRRRRGWLFLGLSLNLGLLFGLKYAVFAYSLVAAGAGWPGGFAALALPLGISFFTLQQVAYLVDLHRGAPVDRDPLHYPLFVAFFPHLIAGPLIHHGEYSRQLAAVGRRPLAPDWTVGATIFTIGLAKKVLLADNLAPLASPTFAAAAAGTIPDPASAWIAALAWSLQLYFDFSGYSDMAIGLARMFGIVFPLNFASPYRATSIIEFWRRWHITLSRFLRDYLYIPLGGNRHGLVRQHANLLATMLIGGLWHGAGLGFVVWGGLHGLMLAVNHLWRRYFRWGSLPALVGWAMTFLAVVVAWVPFRAADLPAAWRVWSGMAGLASDMHDPAPALAGKLMLVAVCLCIAGLAPNTQTLLRRYMPGLGTNGYATGIASDGDSRLAPRWRPTPGWGLAAGFVLAVCVMGLNRATEFIYFQF